MGRLTFMLIEMTYPPSFGSIQLALAGNLGFNARELRTIEKVAGEHHSQLLERWSKEYGHATGSTS